MRLFWWAHVDLNHGPHPYQGCALTGLSYGPLYWSPEGENTFGPCSVAAFIQILIG